MWIPNDIGLHGNTGIDQYDKVELNDSFLLFYTN